MSQHRQPRRYIGYHLMVAGLLGAVALTAACTDDPAPAPKPAVEVVTPQPEPVPAPESPAAPDPAPVAPVEAAAVEETDPEPAEEIPSNDDVRPDYGPEDCGPSNEGPGMTQAEWMEFCYPNTIEDLPGSDFYPEGEEVECQGYGCSPEQDAALNAAEAEVNDGY